MIKTGLVLEGGGVRGAYTAGALAWLNEHGVTFDYGVGISSGAVYLTCAWQKNTSIPYHMSVDYAADPENVGLKAFRKEGYYVAYKHIFEEDLLGKEHMSVKELREDKANIEVGVYDIEKGETVYFGAEALDDQLDLLRGCCALPVASAIVEYNGHKYLDGGITKMIPIERAVEQGVNRSLVITTKPADFVRKPANWFVKLLMRICYRKYPAILRDYKVRHLNYKKQVDLIKELVEKKEALLVYPSVTIDVSRFKGDTENCKKLYDLGYSDMEARKDEILSFVYPKTIEVPVLEKVEA